MFGLFRKKDPAIERARMEGAIREALPRDKLVRVSTIKRVLSSYSLKELRRTSRSLRNAAFVEQFRRSVVMLEIRSVMPPEYAKPLSQEEIDSVLQKCSLDQLRWVLSALKHHDGDYAFTFLRDQAVDPVRQEREVYVTAPPKKTQRQRQAEARAIAEGANLAVDIISKLLK